MDTWCIYIYTLGTSYHRANQISGKDIQEATASEPLSLEEEYENQQSWRTAGDKLTFIICRPLKDGGHFTGDVTGIVRAGTHDVEDRMVGDVNFFLHAHPDLEGRLVGELDVMVAEKSCRRTGLGRASCVAVLDYARRRMAEMLDEYHDAGVTDGATSPGQGQEGKENGVEAGERVTEVMVKIKEGNVGSRGLFRALGFEDDGKGVNYFGEVRMVLPWKRLGERPWADATGGKGEGEEEEEVKELPYENDLAKKT